MDALELLKKYQRMCASHEVCNSCPLHKKKCLNTLTMTEDNLIQFVNHIEDWSRNHPLVIDWTKVPRNTPVLVCNSIDEGDWERQYFCAYLAHSMSGNFLTFYGGDEENANNVMYWRYCRLAPEIDTTPYLKGEKK